MRTDAPKKLTDIITDSADSLRAMKAFKGAKYIDEQEHIPNRPVKQTMTKFYQHNSPREAV